MQKLNLYKLSFSAESGAIANIIVAAKENFSERCFGKCNKRRCFKLF